MKRADLGSTWTTLLAAFTLLFIGVSSAQAAFMSYICNDAACAGGDDVIVTDNGPGDNFPGSALLGQINAGALSFNGFTIITNVSQSKPLSGSASQPELSLSFDAVTNDNLAHTVFLYASDTSFTGIGTLLLSLTGTQPPAGDGNNVVGRAWAGAVNVNTPDPRSAGPLLINTGSVTATPFSVSGTSLLSPLVNPYALSIGVQITRGSAGTTTGEETVTLAAPTAVPEPPSLALVAAALIALMALIRRVAQRS